MRTRFPSNGTELGILFLITAAILAIVAFFSTPAFVGVNCGKDTMNPNDPREVCASYGIPSPDDRTYEQQEAIEQEQASHLWLGAGACTLLGIITIMVSRSSKNSSSSQSDNTFSAKVKRRI
ncbi:hypothetical protein EPA93_19980 [Ktedonosporobacter rubrisoli]|uniref:Uncharacterized protein n=1 Tax=Ktedonosporobacter rubrisoli TaxID=2509675 RepID=A0A4P6JSG7_KTERU|nr:hypothetical protein [Ktedonosporobacter rubrisoli]QBD78152.1 hypothetical protein EPA93_19980 [Ktedonosporobacter rubrisoli]